jgi:hypothetical protein
LDARQLCTHRYKLAISQESEDVPLQFGPGWEGNVYKNPAMIEYEKEMTSNPGRKCQSGETCANEKLKDVQQ